MQTNPYTAPRPQVIYEADQGHVDNAKALREKLHGICRKQLMHRHVLVKTIDGHQYEGVIVHLDEGNIYISLAEDGHHHRGYGYYYNNYRFFPGPAPYPVYNPGAAILPLVLYNLLAITLLT